MLLRTVVYVVLGIVVLPFTHASASATHPPGWHDPGQHGSHGQHGLDRPGTCRLLPPSRQPGPAAPQGGSAKAGAGGGAVLTVMVPATTCNTRR